MLAEFGGITCCPLRPDKLVVVAAARSTCQIFGRPRTVRWRYERVGR